MSRLGTIAAAAALGAGAAYFLDPDQGHSRRVRTWDMLGARSRRATRNVERRVRYERGRARGVWHNARSGPREQPADDHVLVDRVRSEVLGRTRHAAAVNVDAVKGVVSLRGELPDEASIIDLRERVAAVPGVVSVENLLHVPGEIAPNKADALAPPQHG
jgi:osmotically-inducible protein OsmY